MEEITLISPYPEADLPNIFQWIQPFIYQTAHYSETIEQFVGSERERLVKLKTWGIRKDGDTGGYIEFEPQGEKMGLMNMICRRSFFRDDVTRPALNLALAEVFERDCQIVIFQPALKARAIKRVFRECGAKEVGRLEPSNGLPVRMAMALTEGDWLWEQNVKDFGVAVA